MEPGFAAFYPELMNKLSAHGKLVYLYLCEQRYRKGKEYYYQSIGHEVELDRRTVAKAVKELETEAIVLVSPGKGVRSPREIKLIDQTLIKKKKEAAKKEEEKKDAS